MVKFRMKPSKATEIRDPATMSAAMTESPSQQEDPVEDVEKTESLAETQTINEAASARASLRTRPRSRANLGTSRGREKSQLSCNICRQRK